MFDLQVHRYLSETRIGLAQEIRLRLKTHSNQERVSSASGFQRQMILVFMLLAEATGRGKGDGGYLFGVVQSLKRKTVPQIFQTYRQGL